MTKTDTWRRPDNVRPYRGVESDVLTIPITTWPDEDVYHLAVLVDGISEVLPLALDGDEELVQLPRVTQRPFPPLEAARMAGA